MVQNFNVSPIQDPNALAAIQQLATAVNEVEQRIQLLKYTIGQSVPQLVGSPFSSMGGMQGLNPYTQFQGLGSQGIGAQPFGHQGMMGQTNPLLLALYAQQLQGLQNPGFGTGFGGVTPFSGLGVNAPFGTPSIPFRPW